MKLIIFDQDGTLYPKNSTLTKQISERTKSWLKKRLNISNEQIEDFYTKLPVQYPNIYDAIRAYNLAFEDYFDLVFGSLNLKDYNYYNKNLVNFFQKNKDVDIIVVTLAPIDYSNNIQEKMGIKSYVKKTYCLYKENLLNKYELYEKIRLKNKLKRSDIVIVGDNFLVDIKKASEKGYTTFLIGQEYKDINDLISKWNKANG